ncbi:MAG: hypothetical protein GY745_04230 [Actinomycetia bacterium]|nr:hypothetical protein [Actinomycetes bacterium]MCP4084247.1 hypothetical protein [Actinomycetes bacterium]
MSAAPASRERRETESSRRPELRIVERVRSAQRPLLMGLIVVTVVGALFALAALNAVLVAGQADLDAVNRQIDYTERQQTRLQVQVAELAAPEQIIARAEAMGMTRSAQPVHIAAVEDPLGPPPEAPPAEVSAESTDTSDADEAPGDGS